MEDSWGQEPSLMTVGSGVGIQSQLGFPPVLLCPLRPVSIFSNFRKGPLYAPVGYLLLLLSVPAAGWALLSSLLIRRF